MKRVIAFHPEVAEELGNDQITAIYYQQLDYWSEKGSRPDGFIYKSKEEIRGETTLTREQQDRARNKLVSLGWLETKLIKAKGAPTLHYRILKPIKISIGGKPANLRVENPPMETSETHESLTEITTETTSEKEIKSSPTDSPLIKEIIDYLNLKTRSNYRASVKKNIELIKARLRDGFTVSDFKRVVDNKVAEWGGDPKMDQYLRPVTLFGTKFESYLNQKVAGRIVNQGGSETDRSGWPPFDAPESDFPGYNSMYWDTESFNRWKKAKKAAGY
jgi:uncharacterized phage protein (TIGR02220 family)